MRRKTVRKRCLTCRTPFDAPLKEIRRNKGKFCSLSCASKSPTKFLRKPNTLCAQCGKNFFRAPSKKANSKSGIHFCSRSCKDQSQRIGGIAAIQPPHYGNGLFNYREKAFRENPPICKGCGYKAHRDVLEVHHRDKDRTNNTVANLVLLCPTCHSEVHKGHRKL